MHMPWHKQKSLSLQKLSNWFCRISRPTQHRENCRRAVTVPCSIAPPTSFTSYKVPCLPCRVVIKQEAALSAATAAKDWSPAVPAVDTPSSRALAATDAVPLMFRHPPWKQTRKPGISCVSTPLQTANCQIFRRFLDTEKPAYRPIKQPARVPHILHVA